MKYYFFKLISPKVYNYFIYYYLHLKKLAIPKILTIDVPTTFNEKIIWLKLYKNDASLSYLVDKIKVKEYIKSKIGEKYLIPTYKIFDDPSKITISQLPKKFILKMNHASGCNIICSPKVSLSFSVPGTRSSSPLLVIHFLLISPSPC